MLLWWRCPTCEEQHFRAADGFFFPPLFWFCTACRTLKAHLGTGRAWLRWWLMSCQREQKHGMGCAAILWNCLLKEPIVFKAETLQLSRSTSCYVQFITLDRGVNECVCRGQCVTVTAFNFFWNELNMLQWWWSPRCSRLTASCISSPSAVAGKKNPFILQSWFCSAVWPSCSQLLLLFSWIMNDPSLTCLSGAAATVPVLLLFASWQKLQLDRFTSRPTLQIQTQLCQLCVAFILRMSCLFFLI